MLTLEDEERAQELRRELVVVLHLAQERLPLLRQITGWREAFAPLEDVRSTFEGVDESQAVVRIATPPFLSQDRLRPILASCLEGLLGGSVLFSIRILTELAETIQAAFEMEELWLEEGGAPGRTVLCFTDEAAVGTLDLLQSELQEELRAQRWAEVSTAFPLNHYDVLLLWAGPSEEKISSTEAFVAGVYESLTGAPVSATSRDLGQAADLLAFLGA
ncbi:MAG: hypothetical protein ACE5JE_08305 [Thermoplasmata archaeon]